MINHLNGAENKVLSIGSSRNVLQSILDFDFLVGKPDPSVICALATGIKSVRLFWGNQVIMVPAYKNYEAMPPTIKEKVNLLINLSSGRRTLTSTLEAINKLPNLIGGMILAESVPERHALELKKVADEKGVFLIGPASVGLVIPGRLKLGLIGGVEYKQILDSNLMQAGDLAIITSSGGMVNELINFFAKRDKGVSFAVSVGGERFPILSPQEAILAAQKDKKTKQIIYYGELGGRDEYEIAELLKSGKVTKKVYAHIAGTVSEVVDQAAQFGHAKALASTHDESAVAKRKALAEVGVIVSKDIKDFTSRLEKINSKVAKLPSPHIKKRLKIIESRKTPLFVSRVSSEDHEGVKLLGEDVVNFIRDRTFDSAALSLLLRKNKQHKDTTEFFQYSLKLLIDHGPNVSGAVNTIISARAGKDLVSSLASGLLTVGPKFGGALNAAGKNWLKAVNENVAAKDFVEDFAKRIVRIPGIGHKKYSVYNPDPRVKEILKFTRRLKKKKHTEFALEIEKITTSKKGNLILNVDGAIAAVFLDILHEKEKYDYFELKRLVDTEFFNAVFVLARSVGFIAHYLDQKEMDEGLFRMPSGLIVSSKISE